MRVGLRSVPTAAWIILESGLAGAVAQTVPVLDATFDVASIKPAGVGMRGYSIRPLHDRLSAQNVTLKLLIGEAYHVYDFQISGGPRWIDSDRYDVEAKAASDTPPTHSRLREMLQNLLADRFALIVRHEIRERPVYMLEAAKAGPKIEPAKHPDAAVMFRVFQRRQVTSENAPLVYLTEALTLLLGRPVLDRTGLQGNFDYKLEWSPDELQVQSQEAPPQVDGVMPSLVAALQQQMGLRLLSKRSPVDLIVVERAEKPTPN